jgi:hypothetical protein
VLFFGFGSTLIDAHTLPGQTEGLKVGCGGMGGWVGCGGMGGLQKLITVFSGWAGLQKLITDLDMKNGYKGGVKGWFH